MHSPVTGLTRSPCPVLKVKGHCYYETSLQPFSTGMSVTTKDCSVKWSMASKPNPLRSGLRSKKMMQYWIRVRGHREAACSVLMCHVWRFENHVSLRVVAMAEDMLACVTQNTDLNKPVTCIRRVWTASRLSVCLNGDLILSLQGWKENEDGFCQDKLICRKINRRIHTQTGNWNVSHELS